MNKSNKLEVTVSGEIIGNITITQEKGNLQITSDGLLSDGTYSFSMDELSEMLLNKVRRQYPDKNIEIKYK